MIRNAFIYCKWLFAQIATDGITAMEIREHIAELRKERERLNRKSMALSVEIQHWSQELRDRRAPMRQDMNTKELGI